MKQEKTAKQIDDWFRYAIEKSLKDVPDRIKLIAHGNNEHIRVIADSIARKNAFRPKPVFEYLKTVL